MTRNGFAYVFINFGMDSPTFSSTSRSACFGDLYASTSEHHDVYTGGRLLHIMQHCQARTSTYGFLLIGILLGATLFILILEVFYILLATVYFALMSRR